MSFSVEFLGCKISQTDMQGVRERLAAGGLSERAEGGSVHVVNTCCVTNEAVAKSRKAVRSALRRGAERVYVTGCATRLAPGTFADAGGRVTVVSESAEEAAERIARELGATACVGPAPRLERTRAFLKVQDGCTFGCAFCVIPRVRGASRSRPLQKVLEEARRRIAQGHRELVVTGVNLGLYRDAEAGARLPTCSARSRSSMASPACGFRRSRSTTSAHGCARRSRTRGSVPTCTSRCSPVTTACCGRCGAATTSRPTLAASSARVSAAARSADSYGAAARGRGGDRRHGVGGVCLRRRRGRRAHAHEHGARSGGQAVLRAVGLRVDDMDDLAEHRLARELGRDVLVDSLDAHAVEAIDGRRPE